MRDRTIVVVDDVLAPVDGRVIADDRQVVQAAVNAGLTGIMLKCHHESTVSRAYLLSAIAGNASERLALLAALIARGATPPEVHAATRAALAVGATSGADGVIGLLAGAAVWSPHASAALAALAPQR